MHRIVETLILLGQRGGQLGVSTIVGSAAYNVRACACLCLCALARLHTCMHAARKHTYTRALT